MVDKYNSQDHVLADEDTDKLKKYKHWYAICVSGVYFHCLFLFYGSAMNEALCWCALSFQNGPNWLEVEHKGTSLVKAFISIKRAENPNQKQLDKL